MRLTGRVAAAGAVAAALLMTPAARVAACDCDSLEPAEALAASTVAFEGVVSRVVEERAPDGGPHRPFMDPVLTSFVVDQPLKGGLVRGDRFELRMDGPQSDCTAFFVERQRWRLYLAPGDGRLTTHLCAGNELLAENAQLPASASAQAAPPPTVLLVVGTAVVLLAAIGALAFRPGRRAR